MEPGGQTDSVGRCPLAVMFEWVLRSAIRGSAAEGRGPLVEQDSPRRSDRTERLRAPAHRPDRATNRRGVEANTRFPVGAPVARLSRLPTDSTFREEELRILADRASGRAEKPSTLHRDR